jgi:hypothetical protein
VRIYGKSVEAPSRVHSITCGDLDDGLRCTMSPLAPGLPRNYRIVIATDEKQEPTVLTATKDVELQRLSDFLANDKWLSINVQDTLAFVSTMFVFVGILFGIGVLKNWSERKKTQ